MVFSSLLFIFRFLPIFLIIYYLVPPRYKNIVLLLGSLCFYAYGEPRYLLLILLSIGINFKLAWLIEISSSEPVQKRIWFVVALIYNFGILFFFKYINFTIENLNYILSGLGIHHPLSSISVGLPLGISFFTFQITSYIIDVYRRDIKAEKSIFHFSLYIGMFPQLISGPIMKYSEIKSQLLYRKNTLTNLEAGLKLFTIGLGVKVLLANRIGILWNDIQTIGFESISTPLAWLGAVGYSIQLYFDFWGYSLMAIGVGRMLGFKLIDNFNHPYIAKSVSEFWRRWHISLGRWFKDYIYIPLGGNRRGKARLVLNLLVVWMFTGIWHGANWNFVLWGITLFLLIYIEKMFLKKYLDRSIVLSRIYMLLIMPMSWMLFAIPSLSDIRVYFGRMLALVPGVAVNSHDFVKYVGLYKIYFILGIFLCMPFAWSCYKKYERTLVCSAILFCVFWYAIYQLANGLNNPFLYFKF